MLVDDSATKLKIDEDVLEYADSPPLKKKKTTKQGLLSKSKSKKLGDTEMQNFESEKNKVSFRGDEQDGVLNLHLGKD